MIEKLKKFLIDHPEEAIKTWKDIKSMNLPNVPKAKDFLKIQYDNKNNTAV